MSNPQPGSVEAGVLFLRRKMNTNRDTYYINEYIDYSIDNSVNTYNYDVDITNIAIGELNMPDMHDGMKQELDAYMALPGATGRGVQKIAESYRAERVKLFGNMLGERSKMFGKFGGGNKLGSLFGSLKKVLGGT